MAAVSQDLDINKLGPKKGGKSRKALTQKNPSQNETNIAAGEQPIALQPSAENSVGKENPETVSQKRTKKGASKGKQASSFEKEMQEMQEQLEKLKLEKEQIEENLKEKEESLKQKEEELEIRDREQQKLKNELKKMQKVKEFKPTMSFPLVVSQNNKKNLTKKPSPAYTLWCKDNWNEVKKSNPNADFSEISNILGAKWKTVTAEEKKPYEDRYLAEKEAYLKAIGNEKREQEAMKLLEDEHKQKTAMELLEQYLQFQQQMKEEPKKSKKDKDPLKPKQPMSAYFIYSNERRAALVAENKSILESAKITGEEWKTMNEKQRAPYEKMALQLKEKYTKEMELYKLKIEEEAANKKKEDEEEMKLQKHEAMQLLKKKEKTQNLIKKTKDKNRRNKPPSDPNKPKKPASSFLLFSKETRKATLQERPGINNSTLNALISVKWKELNDEERKIWNDKAAKALQEYKKAMEEYNKTKPEEASTTTA